MGNETVYQGPELEETSKGSVILGIVGALVGAVIGAIPWFLASTFTHFFIGYLGFLIGWAAAFGYGVLHGRRSFPVAIVTVVVSSIIALVLADFASNMYVLCTDADALALAHRWRMSVAELAFMLITDPDNLGDILPNLIMGMVIGLLGVASATGYVRNYTQSGEVRRPEGAPVMAGGVNGWTQPASTGLDLPRQFTVRMPKRNMVMGIVLLVFFGLLFAFTIVMGIVVDMGAGMPIMSMLWIFFLVMAVILILQGKNWRLEVDGDRLCAYTAFGKATEFHVSDIANVSMPSMLNGYAKLYGQDGKTLFKFTTVMPNQPLLMQYLAEHNVPLRG